MLRTLLSPRWLAYLALACLFAVVTVLLGKWQWGRHEDALAYRATVEAHYAQAPVPLAEALGTPPSFTAAQEWTRVTATGEYDPAGQLLVRNRPLHATYGYEVLVPLSVDGETLMVDRGWVANAANAATAPEVPAAPGGQVQVTGWLRPSEPDLSRDLPPGQLASIDLQRAAAALGAPVLPAYLVLESETVASGAVPARPEPLEAPDTGLGSHLAYALQWWGSSVLGFVLVVVMARREHLEGAAGAAPADAEGAPVPVPAGRKRTRIWDEEDE